MAAMFRMIDNAICQNGGVSANITLGSNFYAAQPIWSNNSTTSGGSHCVTSHA